MRGAPAPPIGGRLTEERTIWRPIIVVLVLTLLLGGWLRSRESAVVAPVPDEAPAAVAYGELRLLFPQDPRGMEMAALLEFPSLASCRQPRAQDAFGELCRKDGSSCRFDALVCREDVAPRYRRVLEGQPAALHYARIVYRLRYSSSRPRAVIVAWGATVEESMTLCRMMIEDWPAERGDAQCI